MHQSKGGRKKTNPSIFNNPLQELHISHLCTHGWQNDGEEQKPHELRVPDARRLQGLEGMSGLGWDLHRALVPRTEMCLPCPAQLPELAPLWVQLLPHPRRTQE